MKLSKIGFLVTNENMGLCLYMTSRLIICFYPWSDWSLQLILSIQDNYTSLTLNRLQSFIWDKILGHWSRREQVCLNLIHTKTENRDSAHLGPAPTLSLPSPQGLFNISSHHNYFQNNYSSIYFLVLAWAPEQHKNNELFLVQIAPLVQIL